MIRKLKSDFINDFDGSNKYILSPRFHFPNIWLIIYIFKYKINISFFILNKVNIFKFFYKYFSFPSTKLTFFKYK